MKTQKLIAGLIAVVTTGITALQAWDGCGHEVVATIAYEQLPATVKAKVDKVFANDPRGRTFIDAATWADDIKAGKRNDPPSKALNKSWHFIDLPFQASPDEIERLVTNDGIPVNPHREKTGTITTAITYYANYLKAVHGTRLARADALSFLIHYVGDIHQPLHCVTVEEPLPNYTLPSGGDLGGNGFGIHHPAGELHALWDDSFDEPTDDKGTGRDASIAHAKEVADALRPKFKSTQEQIDDDDPADWARESYSYREFAYNLPEDPASKAASKSHVVTPEYLTQQQQIAGARVVLAGDRLAALLKWIYTK